MAFDGCKKIWMNGRLIDFEKATIHVLSHVIHYSLPEDPAVYLHRSGRTGRIGKSGVCTEGRFLHIMMLVERVLTIQMSSG